MVDPALLASDVGVGAVEASSPTFVGAECREFVPRKTVTRYERGDIAQKHDAPRFASTGGSSQWSLVNRGETGMTMTDVVATNPIEMPELTIGALDQAGGGK